MNKKFWLVLAIGCLHTFFVCATTYSDTDRVRSSVVWITQKGAALGWDDKAWDQRANETIVASMLAQSIRALTDQSTVKGAWDFLFINHNDGTDYQAGEQIAIKINNNNHCPLPQVIVPLLSQLISNKGVRQSDIVIYDVSRGVPDYLVDAVKRVFPGVRFGSANDCSSQTVFGAKLSRDLVNAKYLINMPLLRTHFMAGATLSFKNNLGSTCNPSFFHNNFFQLDTTNGLFQLNNNPNVKDKTLLVVADGLYGLQSGGPSGDPDSSEGIKPYPESLFLSADSVAVDSVMIDYLQSTGSSFNGKISQVRNYLQVSGSHSLGNFGTSCLESSCSFVYPDINLIRCNPTCL